MTPESVGNSPNKYLRTALNARYVGTYKMLHLRGDPGSYSPEVEIGSVNPY